MANVADWLKVDSEQVAQSLQEAARKLESADRELVLDFSSVARIDAPALAILHAMSEASTSKGLKITLRGVNVDIYKVLLLAGVSSHFVFLN